MLCCGTICGQGVREGRMPRATLLGSLPTFHHFPPGTLACTVYLAPSCSSRLICTQMWEITAASCSLTHLSPPGPLCPTYLLLPACLCPSNHLDECFFFNSLVVALPCSLIFWQFWLFFVFKLVVILISVM